MLLPLDLGVLGRRWAGQMQRTEGDTPGQDGGLDRIPGLTQSLIPLTLGYPRPCDDRPQGLCLEGPALSSKASRCPIESCPYIHSKWPRNEFPHITEGEPGPEKGSNLPKVTQPDADKNSKLLMPGQA